MVELLKIKEVQERNVVDLNSLLFSTNSRAKGLYRVSDQLQDQLRRSAAEGLSPERTLPALARDKGHQS